MASKRVFVTGANGKVGLPLVRALVERGDHVTGLARSEDKAGVVRALGARCLVGSLEHSEALDEGIRDADVVFHLAGGLRGPGRETADRVNHRGTCSLLESLQRIRSDGLESVVFTSTAAIYGDRSSLWLDETMPPLPNTAYGRSKVDAENALLQAFGGTGLPVRIIRLSAVYGPGFPFMMADRIRAGKAWLPGEGRNYTSTIHVDDAVSGILRVQVSGTDGETYNLADPNPMSLKAFYQAVHARVGGRPVRFWSTWIPSYVQHWAAHKNEDVQSRLGRRPMFTMDNLKLFTASARLKVDRMEKELGFVWRYPNAVEGLQATLG